MATVTRPNQKAFRDDGRDYVTDNGVGVFGDGRGLVCFNVNGTLLQRLPPADIDDIESRFLNDERGFRGQMLYRECMALAEYARAMQPVWQHARITQFGNRLFAQQRAYLVHCGAVNLEGFVIKSIDITAECRKLFSTELVLDLARIGVLNLSAADFYAQTHPTSASV
jgi:hypothetical protein